MAPGTVNPDKGLGGGVGEFWLAIVLEQSEEFWLWRLVNGIATECSTDIHWERGPGAGGVGLEGWKKDNESVVARLVAESTIHVRVDLGCGVFMYGLSGYLELARGS